MSEKYEIRILKIKELTCSFDFDKLNTIDVDSLYVTFGLDVSRSEFDKDVLLFKSNATYLYNLSGVEKKNIFKIVSEIAFKIPNLGNVYLTHNETEFELPEGLMNVLVGTCFSTLRGMIAIRTANTILEKFPMQITDMSSMLHLIGAKEGHSNAASLKRSKKKA
jgi:hypothetical protein